MWTRNKSSLEPTLRVFLAFCIFVGFGSIAFSAENISPANSACQNLGASCDKKADSLFDSLKISCEANRKELHCDKLFEHSSPEERENFYSCENKEDLCDQATSTSLSKLYSCGKGLAQGVLIDPLIGIYHLGPAVWEIARGRADLPKIFKECPEDLDSKKIILGGLRPPSMPDFILEHMSCTDVKRFTQKKAEVILDKLEQKRQNEMALKGSENLDVYDMNLTEAEKQALDYDNKQVGLVGKTRCFRPQIAANIACHEIAGDVMAISRGVGMARIGASLVRKFEAKAGTIASEAKLAKSPAEPPRSSGVREKIEGEEGEFERIIPGTGSDTLSKTVRSLEKDGSAAYVKTFTAEQKAKEIAYEAEKADGTPYVVYQKETLKNPDKNSQAPAHETTHANNTKRRNEGQDLGIARTVSFESNEKVSIISGKTHARHVRVDEVHAKAVDSGVEISYAKKALGSNDLNEMKKRLSEAEFSISRAREIQKKSKELIQDAREYFKSNSIKSYDPATGKVSMNVPVYTDEAQKLVTALKSKGTSTATIQKSENISMNFQIEKGLNPAEAVVRSRVILDKTEADLERFTKTLDANKKKIQALKEESLGGRFSIRRINEWIKH